ncbi:MAG: hypothetical protein IAI49_10375 [Candidatus Eremiobacteraeota bacterium]|nr:hypothetical protein [Candidatus Eremiobacteraeota bacterium]
MCAVAACTAPDPRALARADDRRYGTGAFTWLVDHEPSAVVISGAGSGAARELLPESEVVAAPPAEACARAARSHALFVLIAPQAARRERAAAADCGFALFRDSGGTVVAPR